MPTERPPAARSPPPYPPCARRSSSAGARSTRPRPASPPASSVHLDPAHRPALFDYAGNIGPTVWWNGEIVGGWAQRPSGEIAWRLLGDPGLDAEEAVTAEAIRLAQWLGEARVTPRFRTPLERELVA
ncbi:DNA glycosylase AlkZ-like family protein [Streptomyces goshikiensis]|uniref:DNA glycosylase AlkZ-like family protein n=1 Tax=Streptomyces goshikiensis TaxID=1942 RepID=UPI0037204D5A